MDPRARRIVDELRAGRRADRRASRTCSSICRATAARRGPTSRRGLDALADHLAAWLAERAPAILIGHSMGGVLATLVAERGRLRARSSTSTATCRAATARSAAGDRRTPRPSSRRAGSRDCARGSTPTARRSRRCAVITRRCASRRRAMFHRHASDLVALSDRRDAGAAARGAARVPALYIARRAGRDLRSEPRRSSISTACAGSGSSRRVTGSTSIS